MSIHIRYNWSFWMRWKLCNCWRITAINSPNESAVFCSWFDSIVAVCIPWCDFLSMNCMKSKSALCIITEWGRKKERERERMEMKKTHPHTKNTIGYFASGEMFYPVWDCYSYVCQLFGYVKCILQGLLFFIIVVAMCVCCWNEYCWKLCIIFDER